MLEKYLRPGIAELVGAFFLTFVGAGAMCVNAMLQSYGKGGDASGLLGVALATGLAMSIGVTAVMAMSGGHLNPAITITLWVYKKIDTDMAIAYILSQVLGAVVAGGLIVFLFQGQTAVATAGHYGAPHINLDLFPASSGLDIRTLAWGAAVETVLTFLVVFAFFGTLVDPRAPKVAGFAVGLTVAACILVGGPLTGAAMNPARAFGPALWEAGSVDNFNLLRDQVIYWVGPIVGGILAGGLYINCILPPESHQTPAHSHAAPGKA